MVYRKIGAPALDFSRNRLGSGTFAQIKLFYWLYQVIVVETIPENTKNGLITVLLKIEVILIGSAENCGAQIRDALKANKHTKTMA